MTTVLYIISILIMFVNTICVIVLFNSIKLNKQLMNINNIIENINNLRTENRFIVRNKECQSLGYSIHSAVRNGDPLLILDID